MRGGEKKMKPDTDSRILKDRQEMFLIEREKERYKN
jgi:hypothetical protein